MNIKQTIEGIFDVESKDDGFEFQTSKTSHGDIVKIDEKELTYYSNSTAIFTHEMKKIDGVVLTLRTSRGTEKVYFPRELSLMDKQAILNQQVRYNHHTWRTNTEGTSDMYTLEILSGQLTGEKLTKRVFV